MANGFGPTQAEKCIRFEDCEAPLCPLQPQSVEGGIWYPGEAICRLRRFQRLPWVAKQRGIVKAGAPPDGFFTVRMLQAIRRVAKGIAGADPDFITSEDAWLRARGQKTGPGPGKKAGVTDRRKHLKTAVSPLPLPLSGRR